MNELLNGFQDTYSIGATKDLEFGKHQLRFKNVKLLEVAAAFRNNMERACRLTTFLPYLVTLATERERLYCKAHQEICGSVEVNVDELSETTKESIMQRIRERDREMLNQESPRERQEWRWNYGLDLMNEAINHEPNSLFRSALELLHPSAILSAWTAVEVLAGDLWVAALNEHPVVLAQLSGDQFNKWEVGKSNDPDTGDYDTAQKTKNDDDGKQISLQRLAKADYDIGKSMGEMLRHKVRFTTLWEIRRAYCQAFSKDFDAIAAALSDHAFDHLAAIRNAIVHKAGKADRQFVRFVKKSPRLSAIREGDNIPINGLLLSELIPPVIIKAVEFLNAVGVWICDRQRAANDGESDT